MNEVIQILEVWCEPVALGTLRALGILAILPLGSVTQFAALRFSMAVGLSIFSIDFLSEPASLTIVGALSEVLFGLCIGLPTALILSAIAMAAELHEVVRGQMLGSIMDPLANQESSAQEPVFAVLIRSLIWALLLAAGLGDLIVLRFYESVNEFPLGSLSLLNVTSLSVFIAKATLSCLEFTFILVFPVVIIALLVELAFGFLTKVAPKVSFTNEVFLVKSYLMLFVLVASWNFGLMESLKSASEPRIPDLRNSSLIQEVLQGSQ